MGVWGWGGESLFRDQPTKMKCEWLNIAALFWSKDERYISDDAIAHFRCEVVHETAKKKKKVPELTNNKIGESEGLFHVAISNWLRIRLWVFTPTVLKVPDQSEKHVSMLAMVILFFFICEEIEGSCSKLEIVGYNVCSPMLRRQI